MTAPMRVDPTLLRSAEPEFDTMAAGVDGLLVRLCAALAAEGVCWGTDEAGSAFQQAYQPVADLVRDALPRLRDGFAGTGASINAVADTVDSAEGRTRSRFE